MCPWALKHVNSGKLPTTLTVGLQHPSTITSAIYWFSIQFHAILCSTWRVIAYKDMFCVTEYLCEKTIVKAPVNVMPIPSGGGGGKFWGFLKQKKNCVRIPTRGHGWMSESITFPRVHPHYCSKMQCQNSHSQYYMIRSYQNLCGCRNVF